ncbi:MULTISPECIES: CaiB/BaiF CoA-transferase family protein [unclassified Nocardioides]|uniref:CaiB/BaiF CoA transferase family protein n=1 Tax=unclassified Nocardioides TaxID=2615069 RepID=UPI00114FF96C|nr:MULTISPECIES: CoA transferase [unclassified Nocardioides]TQK72131.1 crotonobetainyl-CoA:carnitine CoA-transferase CaiB-like acyl-CoA transferase [Nocardioides sp. SLBN-35]WGY03651.1 CoA transferase [Nocardioides sp. QY071]
MTHPPLLDGIRVVECTLLEPGALGMTLGDLGAEVIKVEPPGGDYIRRLGWPIVEGSSLLHWHVNRGKRSIRLDLRSPGGPEVFLDLVAGADIVVEGMRPGALERRGLGFDRLRGVNPAIVLCSLSGFGIDGPYRDLPSHGVGFDAWAGLAAPAVDEQGFTYIPEHTGTGTKVGPLWGALAAVSAVLRARRTGVGCHLDISQSDAAAFSNWLPIEGHRAYERPEPEVTGNPADGGARRRPGPGGMEEAVRYQYYRSADGHVLFQASEQEFWRNFCVACDRLDLFEGREGQQYGDHATGDRDLRAELRALFATRTTADWVELGLAIDCPIAPVNDAAGIGRDPQFAHRMPWWPAAEHGADLLPTPVNVVGEQRRPPRRAPEVGADTEAVLAELGYAEDRVASLRRAGVI